MLEKYGAEWGNKVRIVGLSVDDEISDVKNRVEDQKWTSVEHFCMEGWNH